ncbi:MAG: ester cyclase [Caldilineaceae bacterium]|nr:ester cyclase [Caldilineaceae bacterium]
MRSLAEAVITAWNSHDFTQVEYLYSPHYEGYDVAQAAPQAGLEGIRSALENYWRAFPDLHFTLEQSVIEGDQMSLFWRARGTHRGPILNIPATGRRIDVQGVALHRLLDNKVVYCLYIWDTAGLLRSLGLLPELAA